MEKINKSTGTLYICGTPIGNLEDITLRTIRILGEVHLIASEDTRSTGKILEKFNIKTPQISYHRHSNTRKKEKLLEELKNGKNIALVSEAGMPGISDPGEELIALCIEEHIKIIAIPGCSSVTTAVALSGLSTRRFVFEGFLPREGKGRRRRLRLLKDESRTIVLYLSPHRVCKELKDILSIWGDRQVFWGRELTKKFEECWRGNLSNLLSHLENRKIKGEITFVIEGFFSEESVIDK
ncbi:MAG TPA: 16S rRNA (cytidine(1402)-2'-O)-methyltransferase [Candidatus Eremiobacteraeota bacterium]|nr:MAG: Ribosomal RNA small subunit methyltransferase I [bacterium ADurb.Bin363]HPZ07112.1 16S rRNA (cytidine(1402)-2'-O)-methyltransferase [Candidatus Eremiobacteraeota bacterium]